MASATSPYLFCEASNENASFIEESLAKHEYMFFIRKMSPDFPDEELNKYIYEYSTERDNQLSYGLSIKKMYHVLVGGLFSIVVFVYVLYIFY